MCIYSLYLHYHVNSKLITKDLWLKLMLWKESPFLEIEEPPQKPFDIEIGTIQCKYT